MPPMAPLRTSISEFVISDLGILGFFTHAATQLDRDKVLTKGKEATGKLLLELQVRKSTADGKGAKEFYTELTNPFPGWDGEIRDLVLKKKLVGGSIGSLSVFTEEFPYSLERFLSNPIPLFLTTRLSLNHTRSLLPE